MHVKMVNIIKCRHYYMISNMVHINRLIDIQYLHDTTISLGTKHCCSAMQLNIRNYVGNAILDKDKVLSPLYMATYWQAVR